MKISHFGLDFEKKKKKSEMLSPKGLHTFMGLIIIECPIKWLASLMNSSMRI